MTVTLADVVAEARTWIGTPYEHQHRAKGHAVDCVGLVIGVARELGLVAPEFDVNAYERRPDGRELLAQCARYLTPVPLGAMQPGHVLALVLRHDPQHLGIVGDYVHGGLSLIHAFGRVGGGGRVEEWRLIPDRKAFRPIQAFALRGVA